MICSSVIHCSNRGNRYVGFLTIPDLALELPVMEDWDYEKLKTAPCRYTGTLLEHDLTIAAHNYLRHFGHLMDLKLGAEVLFTDAVGETTRFTVAELEILPPDAVDRLTAGEYDLTLFTCTYGGATRCPPGLTGRSPSRDGSSSGKGRRSGNAWWISGAMSP